MDDNFKMKKKSTGDKIMERLKGDTKLSDEVKQKIQQRMQQNKGKDSDSGSDNSADDDSDMGDSTRRSQRGDDSTHTSNRKISKSDSV